MTEKIYYVIQDKKENSLHQIIYLVDIRILLMILNFVRDIILKTLPITF